MNWRVALVLVVLGGACSRSRESPPSRESPRPTLPPEAAVAVSRGPVVVESLPMVDDVPVFVLRGAADRPMVGVFLHGYCTHGMGYLQAFQFAAAEVGPFIALQGDVRCPGPFRAWSGDIRAIDRRIDAALQAYIGRTAPEIVLVGSSQGADRAVGLARAFPGKYRHLILQSGAAPVPPSLVPEVSAAYLLVGQNEGQQAMRTTADLWRRAGRRVALTVVERTGHADFGGRGDPLMREAFQFVGVAP